MEYAAGGTLTEYLNKQTAPLPEAEVLEKFTQVCLGLEYIHKKRILHRDLKTQNILLCKYKRVAKIGDFGISKVLSSRSKANTVVGSPSYLSPELCSAKPYNELSDVWALGCVLYEVMALKRAFDAPSLPLLIQQIVNGKFEPIPSKLYSSQLLFLVRCLLSVEASKRPKPSELLRKPLFMKHVIRLHLELGSLANNESGVESEARREVRTQVQYHSGDTGEVTLLPGSSHITSFALGESCMYAATSQGKLLEWIWTSHCSETSEDGWVCLPVAAEGEVVNCEAGDNFLMFINSKNVLHSGGSNLLGCRGRGDSKPCPPEPFLVQSLFGWEVVQVACGTAHSLALTADNEVFTWGLGHDGRLGHGNNDVTGSSSPRRAVLSGDVHVRDLVAGPDCSAIISSSNYLYCCGRNAFNKLLKPPHFRDDGVGDDCIFTFTKADIHEPNLQIKKVVFSHVHVVLLTQDGNVFTAGTNRDLQLGRLSSHPYRLEAMTERAVDIAATSTSTLLLTPSFSVIQLGKGHTELVLVAQPSPSFTPRAIHGVGNKFAIMADSE